MQALNLRITLFEKDLAAADGNIQRLTLWLMRAELAQFIASPDFGSLDWRKRKEVYAVSNLLSKTSDIEYEAARTAFLSLGV